MNIPEITAAEAAAMINHGDWIGVGGFGPAGAPKSITPAIAAKARAEERVRQAKAYKGKVYDSQKKCGHVVSLL